MRIPNSWLVYFMDNPIEVADDWGHPYLWKPSNIDIHVHLLHFQPSRLASKMFPHPYNFSKPGKMVINPEKMVVLC